jgi:hypothetical protein
MANQKGDVFHVLGVVAAHHFGEDQVDGVWAEEFEPPGRGAEDGDDELLPIRAEEDLIFLEEMGDLEALLLELLVDRVTGIPKSFIVD